MRNSVFRKRRCWLGLLIAIAIVLLARLSEQSVPERLVGRAFVIDGDSLRLAGREVRLLGIDAPEGRQMCMREQAPWACGRAAAQALRGLVGGREIVCEVEDVDRYGRLLALCRVGDVAINRWMVANGWAVAYGRFGAEEASAARARRGIWSAQFERPHAWRRRHLGARAAMFD